MATTATTVPVHRLTVEDVYKMVAAGVLDEDDRVELDQGVLVEMVPVGMEHEDAASWLIDHFGRAAGEAWQLRVQSKLLVPGGYRLPDVMLVARRRKEVPATAYLVVEIADTSHARDREKARDYAAIDVPDYWIVDIPARTVTVHRGPLAGAYRQVETCGDGQTVTPLLSGAPAVDVSALLG